MSLSIIHLSDIHIQNNSDCVFSKAEEIGKACSYSVLHNSNVIIVISGDIAFSGKPEQYILANQLIASISNYLIQHNNVHIDYIFVPGNHDCNFNKSSSIRNALIKVINSADIDQEYYNMMTSVQESYEKFCEQYQMPCDRIITTKEFNYNNKKILFVLTNSAWMSTLHETPGKIVIPPTLMSNIDSQEYNIVFSVIHHPENWFNPDYKAEYNSFIRHKTDFILVGHEHRKDNYATIGSNWSIYVNHGKELQDTNSDSSGFSIISFDENLHSFTTTDWLWDGRKYIRDSIAEQAFHKNTSAHLSLVLPNNKTLQEMNDLGVTINHFSKHNVTLTDLFVYPDIDKVYYNSSSSKRERIKTKAIAALTKDDFTLIIGPVSSGKSSLAKMLYLYYANTNQCCIYLDGTLLNSSDEKELKEIIEECFTNQYSKDKLDEYVLLPRENKVIIVDNFDGIKIFGGRRNRILDFLYESFGHTIVFMSSSIEIPALLSCKCFSEMDDIVYYNIRPLGNKKRKDLITNWYSLSDNYQDENEIEEKVDKAINQINIFLGKNSGFVPAIPIFIIGVLQNSNAMSQSYSGSQYGFLYESLIQKSLSVVSADYYIPGNFNILVGILSKLAFYMVSHKKKTFSEDELATLVNEFNSQKKVNISINELLNNMKKARIFSMKSSEGVLYCFKYPYILYYFCGNYIAYHMNDEEVKKEIQIMSSKLYNEDYGNIIIFVCHFANNKDIIETILLNSYSTLENYQPFDFDNPNPEFSDIQTAIDALIPEEIGSNEDVKGNKEERLNRLDDAGIQDGSVNERDSIIHDEVDEKEKDLAAISASFKTLEVLGQILQNYPGDVDGDLKTEMIDEIHDLGMRSVMAIVSTLNYMEEDFVNYVIEQEKKANTYISRTKVKQVTGKFLTTILSGMVRGMINKTASCLNSKNLLIAASDSLGKNTAISAKLILLELKLNFLKIPNYNEIASLKKILEELNEEFALCVLSSIVAQYLKYNTCDYRLRSRLCSLFGFPEKDTYLKSKRNLLEQGLL